MSKRSMNKLKLVTVLLLLGVFSVSPCLALPTYSGSLASDGSADGLIEGNDGWVEQDDPLVLSWTVSPEVLGGSVYWKYEYTFNEFELQGGLSHFIIEVSDDLLIAEIVNPSITISEEDLDDYGPGDSGNPDIPGYIHGIKFDTGQGDDDGTYILSFYSRRNPVWGDFYAKDGNPGGAAWNAGLTDPDSDPDDPPSNGSIDDHLLVPDTTYIPAPGAVLLGSIGVGLVGWLRRRRTL